MCPLIHTGKTMLPAHLVALSISLSIDLFFFPFLSLYVFLIIHGLTSLFSRSLSFPLLLMYVFLFSREYITLFFADLPRLCLTICPFLSVCQPVSLSAGLSAYFVFLTKYLARCLFLFVYTFLLSIYNLFTLSLPLLTIVLPSFFTATITLTITITTISTITTRQGRRQG